MLPVLKDLQRTSAPLLWNRRTDACIVTPMLVAIWIKLTQTFNSLDLSPCIMPKRKAVTLEDVCPKLSFSVNHYPASVTEAAVAAKASRLAREARQAEEAAAGLAAQQEEAERQAEAASREGQLALPVSTCWNPCYGWVSRINWPVPNTPER